MMNSVIPRVWQHFVEWLLKVSDSLDLVEFDEVAVGLNYS